MNIISYFGVSVFKSLNCVVTLKKKQKDFITNKSFYFTKEKKNSIIKKYKCFYTSWKSMDIYFYKYLKLFLFFIKKEGQLENFLQIEVICK